MKCLTGYSDHTNELINAVAATALGASVYEKHFTIDKALPGPDHRMSLDPNELKATVNAIRQTEQALGSENKQLLQGEKENREKLRKSLVAAVEIEQGSIINKNMLTAKRPGNGIPPNQFEKFLKCKAVKKIKQNELIKAEFFE